MRPNQVVRILTLLALFISSLRAFQLSSSSSFKRQSIMTAAQANDASRLTAAPMPTPDNPWYADAAISRDRSHVIDERRNTQWESVSEDKSARFVLMTSQGMHHQVSKDNVPGPVFWTYDQLQQILLDEDSTHLKESLTSSERNNILAWAGEHADQNYWVYYTGDTEILSMDEMTSVLPTHMNEQPQLEVAGLREFGDRLASSTEAAVLATCNGLVEFHKSHLFCSRCGSPTRTSKAGASRTCTDSTTNNNTGNKKCGSSVYPRIDVASIMLITSPCEDYALLGRKHNWPQGRYSTLAGFAEVGETMEQCCIRETLEESGIQVDPVTLRFVASQPWPFPRSLMVGFRGKAKAGPGKELPTINIDEKEMEDIQWFHRDFVLEHLEGGGSTAANFQPNEKEERFHTPGLASLGRMLIHQWAKE